MLAVLLSSSTGLLQVIAHLQNYLPQLVVPPVKDTYEGIDYEISNISLRGFKINRERVHVLLTDNGVVLTASGARARRALFVRPHR